MYYNLILKDYSTIVKSFDRKKFNFSSYQNNALFVVDTNTKQFLPNYISNYIEIEAGEKFKNIESYKKILDKSIEFNLDRGGTFIAIGGGVICDLTGFVASTYMRGAKLIFMPTTLLSMCDASVGGKTGFDYANLKNMVGSFYPASEVLIDSSFLTTLIDTEFKNGLGEVLKSAMLDSEDFFNYIEENIDLINKRDCSVIEILIEKSLMLKCQIVSKDFKESGVRAFLNLGHTFGHAVETIFGFGKIGHGAAVVWGIDKALKLSLAIDQTTQEYLNRFRHVAQALNFDIDFKIKDIENFLNAVSHDKKQNGGKVQFVCQKNIGETFLYKASLDEIKSLL